MCVSVCVCVLDESLCKEVADAEEDNEADRGSDALS